MVFFLVFLTELIRFLRVRFLQARGQHVHVELEILNASEARLRDVSREDTLEGIQRCLYTTGRPETVLHVVTTVFLLVFLK